MDSISDQRGAGQAATASAHPEPVISVRGLVKRYDGHQAVAGIDLEVRRGEIFAFLGPNGAGKTTTVEILEGFRQRTAGEVTVLGQDPATAGGAWRDRVGVVLQESEPEPRSQNSVVTTRRSGAASTPSSRAPHPLQNSASSNTPAPQAWQLTDCSCVNATDHTPTRRQRRPCRPGTTRKYPLIEPPAGALPKALPDLRPRKALHRRLTRATMPRTAKRLAGRGRRTAPAIADPGGPGKQPIPSTPPLLAAARQNPGLPAWPGRLPSPSRPLAPN
jgi:hypothetical protein